MDSVDLTKSANRKFMLYLLVRRSCCSLKSYLNFLAYTHTVKKITDFDKAFNFILNFGHSRHSYASLRSWRFLLIRASGKQRRSRRRQHTNKHIKANQVSHDALRYNFASPILQSRKKCSNGDFSIVEYTGIKTLKGWISSYIESSLHIFCKKCLCRAKNNSFYPLSFTVSGHTYKWRDGWMNWNNRGKWAFLTQPFGQ